MAFLVAQVIGGRYSACLGFESDADADRAAAIIKKASSVKRAPAARKTVASAEGVEEAPDEALAVRAVTIRRLGMLELVRALAIAWKNLAAYPAGHPALAASMALAHRRLPELLTGSGAVTLGVARDGLVCGQEKVTSSHARDLARALYLREVALLRFETGVTAAELETLLRSISLDAGRSDAPPLAGQLAAAGVTHVQVEAVDFSQIRVTDDMTAECGAGHAVGRSAARDPRRPHPAPRRDAGWWIPGRPTARGAGRDPPGGDGDGAGGARTAVSARAPPSARGSTTGLSQVVGKHFSGASAERMLAASQIAELVRALPEDIRGALVAAALRALASRRVGGRTRLKVLADSAAPDTILQALRTIKDEVPLSSHALRLLHALSAVAPSAGRAAGRAARPRAARRAVRPLPRGRRRPLQPRGPQGAPDLGRPRGADLPGGVVDLGDRMMTLTDDAVADHMANASIELLIRLGGRGGDGCPPLPHRRPLPRLRLARAAWRRPRCWPRT